MDMQHLLKQAERLRKDFADLEERLAAYRCEGTAGGGVRVEADGHGNVVGLAIDPELAASGDAALLEQAVLAAVRQTLAQSRAYRDEQRASLTGGLPLPEF